MSYWRSFPCGSCGGKGTWPCPAARSATAAKEERIAEAVDAGEVVGELVERGPVPAEPVP